MSGQQHFTNSGNRLTIVYTVVLTTILLSTLVAQAQSDSLLPKFIGAWQSDGMAFGAQANSTMTWAPSLDGQFVRLDYKIEMQRAGDETQVFQGVAYYKVADGNMYRAFWADNTGDLHPITAEREGDALVSHWGVTGGKQGRTRYELLAPDRMEVTDWLKTGDGWRKFNQNVFSRL